MLTTDEIKEILMDDTLSDARIQKTIDRAYEFLKTYTNNSELPDTLEIEDVALHLVITRLNRDTALAAGKQSETIGGVSFTFANDLPTEVKLVLMKYKKVVAL